MEPRSELRSQLARASAALIASFALVAACVGDDPGSSSSSTSGSGGSDASSSGASPSDGSSGTTSSGGSSGMDATVKKCDPSKDFEKIEDVPFVTVVSGKSARLTPDEQTIYFHVVAPARLKVATKAGALFGTPTDVLGIDSPASPVFPYEDAYPAIGASDKVIFWETSREQDDVNMKRIYAATRQVTGAATPFTNPAAVTSLPNPANGVFIVGDGEIVYGWRDTGPVNKVFRSERIGGSYAAAVDVELGGGAEFPVVTPDDHVMYFSTARNEAAGAGVEIYVALRTGPAASDPFGTAVKVANVNKPGVTNIASWVSADYCRLYFFRNEDQKLLIASKSPPP